MLNILIVDDEPPARARMQQLLQDCAQQVELKVVGEADSGVAALHAVERLGPDVVLLDITMPDMNGIEVARHLAAREQPPGVIFVTAYDAHALEAFEVQALGYLLKPVRADKLVIALQRAQRLSRGEPRLEALARSLGSRRSRSRSSATC